MTSLPESMLACRRAAASSMRIFGMPVSMALAMPPSASISSIRFQARVHQFVREPLHIIGAGPGIDHARDAGFLLQIDLRVARDARGELGGQRQRLVERVGVQRLRVPQRRGQRFDAGAHHIVVRILRGQAPARGLANACAAPAISDSSD